MKKSVIINGANSGIGKAAAIKFAAEGFHVILACRNFEKSVSAWDEITVQTVKQVWNSCGWMYPPCNP